jgi:translocation and assembly module TamA
VSGAAGGAGQWLCQPARRRGTAHADTGDHAEHEHKAHPRCRCEIQAPAELKALLERYLDLVRLGRLVARDDVDDTEWSRLIDATPAQVRSLLQTEGYFSPVIQPGTPAGHGRRPARSRAGAGGARPRLRVGRVSIEAEGELERGAANGDAHAVATLEQIRKAWSLPTGSEFRNAGLGRGQGRRAGAAARGRLCHGRLLGHRGRSRLASQEVRIFVAVDSGPLFRFGKLRIEGLATHDEHTVGYFVGHAARRARHRSPAAGLPGPAAEVGPLSPASA